MLVINFNIRSAVHGHLGTMAEGRRLTFTRSVSVAQGSWSRWQLMKLVTSLALLMAGSRLISFAVGFTFDWTEECTDNDWSENARMILYNGFSVHLFITRMQCPNVAAVRATTGASESCGPRIPHLMSFLNIFRSFSDCNVNLMLLFVLPWNNLPGTLLQFYHYIYIWDLHF